MYIKLYCLTGRHPYQNTKNNLRKYMSKLFKVLLLLLTVQIFGISQNGSENGQKFLEFIENNLNKCSIHFIENGESIIDHRNDTLMPLASTVKIIVAIEYAYQAAEGKIDPNMPVSLDELKKYYTPGYDGGAHPGWLKYSASKIKDGQVALREVAKGMILFSSNANTEFLMDFLGIENVNLRISSLGIKHHTEIYPIVSALYVGKHLYPELNNAELEKALKGLSQSEYINACHEIHEILKADTSFKYVTDFGDLNFNIQRVWSDRLPASTSKEYSELMYKMTNSEFFDKKVIGHIHELLGGIQKNPKFYAKFNKLGFKGGSSAWILTMAFYSEDKQGDKRSFALFFDDLNFFDNTKNSQYLIDFIYDFFTEKKFRKEMFSSLDNKK